MRWNTPVLLLLGSLGILTGFTASGQPQSHPLDLDTGKVSRLAGRRSPVVGAVERVKGAVVNIHSERTIQGNSAPDIFAPSSGAAHHRVNGMGTGIIIDPRGYIVTNQHVVEDVSVLRIGLEGGKALNALVVARNPETDLALLKIDPPYSLPTMPLGTASDLMIGETVVAIGNAYGYAHTVSVGVVSAVKRDVSLNKDLSYKALIQTDASINPGNSGGPLINIHGELVGVNVAIRAGAQGIGFAIPVDQMIRSVSDMLRLRRRGSTYDGMIYRDRLEPAGEGLVRNVVIERVDSDSPAAQAGLRQGDVLVQVSDVKVTCSFDVDRGLLDRKSKESVAFTIRRAEGDKRLDLVLAAPERRALKVAPSELVWSKLGLQLVAIPNDKVARINRQLHGGLEVAAVSADGLAAKAGIRKGDILVGLHQWETLTLDNVIFVLNHPDLGSFQPLSFYILRSGQVRRGLLAQVN